MILSEKERALSSNGLQCISYSKHWITWRVTCHYSHFLSTLKDMNIIAPDVYDSLSHYNGQNTGSKLRNASVWHSKQMVLSAGICRFSWIGWRRIASSEPLLKIRPVLDLCSTLALELIHFRFNEDVPRDGPDGHFPRFTLVAERINGSRPLGYQVAPYHNSDHYGSRWRSRMSALAKLSAKDRSWCFSF